MLALLSIAFFGLVAVIIWEFSKKIFRLSRRHCLLRCIPDSSVESQCRPYSLSSIAAAVSPFQIYRVQLTCWT